MLYAVGIVELELESTSALVLLLFVIPLAFTLSGFLMWIMYALNGLPHHLMVAANYSHNILRDHLGTRCKEAKIQIEHV